MNKNYYCFLDVLLPKKCHLSHHLILFGSQNINIFCKSCAKIYMAGEKNATREGGL